MASSKSLPPEQLEQLAAIPRSKAFMGREFLTWLWCLVDNLEGPLQFVDRATGKARQFDVWVDDRLVLESGRGLSHENVLKGGDPGQSQEASTALANGKTVRELKLGVHVKGMGDFTAMLNESDLNPRTLKLPAGQEDADEGEGKAAVDADQDAQPIVTRIRQTEAFLAVLDTLFGMFMEERVGDAWESEHLPRVRAWIKKRQQASIDSATLH